MDCRLLMIALGYAIAFTACSDGGNPFTKAEDSQNEDSSDTEWAQDDDCSGTYCQRVKETSGSDYDKPKSSSSSQKSSSSASPYDYTITPMNLSFTLTHYEQIVCTMEGKGSKSCNYDDGDPRVWFEITFFDTDGDSTTYSTRDKLGKNWFYYDNTGEWDGEETFTVKVPAFTETIRVCPFVEDDDAFGAHDKMSSGFCYLTNYIGRLDYREITYESDYKNEYCELEWEWYLY